MCVSLYVLWYLLTKAGEKLKIEGNQFVDIFLAQSYKREKPFLGERNV